MKIMKDGIPAYTSDFDKLDSYYDDKDGVNWRDVCRVKDKSTALFDKRWQAATDVIDIIARRIGIDPETSGFYLYGPAYDCKTETESSPLADKLDEWFDRSGDKVKLKKRISELENENLVLRSLIGK